MQLEWQGIMASPQIEDGHLKIADDLLLAFMARSFTIRQMKIIQAIMFLTYRAGKKESQISVHDIRYLTSIRSDVVKKDLEQLISWNVVTLKKTKTGEMILGIQKDYELWVSPPYSDKESEKVHKLCNTLKGEIYNSSNLSSTAQVVQSKAPAELLVNAFQSYLNVALPLPIWRVERARAKTLYASALLLLKQPSEAHQSIMDCLEHCATDDFRRTVKYPVSYVAKVYVEWQKQIPTKPLNIREQEEITEHRFRYDIKTGRWVMV